MITVITVLGMIHIVTRNALTIVRGSRVSDEEQQSSSTTSGAKRTRAKLCIALLCADGWIGISWIAPAAMDLRDHPLKGSQCQAPGTTLAAGLWWQYGFSIAIALSSFLALRHPLSVVKRWQEQRVCIVICVLLAVGIGQAILWGQFHGYTNWGQFCYYGSPRSRSAEIMQFLPRLLSSFAITIIYASLVQFLRKPDITTQCSPAPRVGKSSSCETLCDPTQIPVKKERVDKDEGIPEWEKMVLPDYSKLIEDEESKSPTQRIISRLSTPERAWLKGSRFTHHDPSFSSVSDDTLISSSRPASAISDIVSPPTGGLPNVGPARAARPFTAPSTMPFGHKALPEPIQPSPSLPLAIEVVSRRSSISTNDSSGEVASFSGMLARHLDDAGPVAPMSRPSTPVVDKQGRIESRADVLSKRTWKLLIWFPLTVSRHSSLTRPVRWC